MQNYKNKIKFFVLIVALILICFLGRYFHIDTAGIENLLKKFPVIYAGIIFVILYCVVTFFVWFSKDIFRLVSAILFGAYISTLFVFVAETINAFILFHLARYLGRNYVESSLKERHRKLDEKLAKTNFFWLLMFRAVPLIPLRFLDLACGLTAISFRRYILAVLLGSPLRIFWLQSALASVGKSVFNPSAMIEYWAHNQGAFIVSLVYLVLMIVVAFKLKRRDGS